MVSQWVAKKKECNIFTSYGPSEWQQQAGRAKWPFRIFPVNAPRPFSGLLLPSPYRRRMFVTSTHELLNIPSPANHGWIRHWHKMRFLCYGQIHDYLRTTGPDHHQFLRQVHCTDCHDNLDLFCDRSRDQRPLIDPLIYGNHTNFGMNRRKMAYPIFIPCTGIPQRMGGLRLSPPPMTPLRLIQIWSTSVQ